jgi:HipA-like C-terminal domain
VNELSNFMGLQQKSADSKGPEGVPSVRPYNSSFFHGKFKKYSADLNGVSYILKMREKEAPELPEVEYLCNQIADTLGIPVAKFYLIDFFGDRVYVTQNFIKKGGSQSDLSHIYHFVKPEEQYTCESIIRVITENTKRPYDVEVFVHTCLFDALIGNHDRHGRNLGLVVTSTRTSLSPIYDNASYLSLEKGPLLAADFNPTGKIATSNVEHPSMKDYVREFIKLRLEDQVRIFYSKLKLAKIEALIEASFCTDLMKMAIKKMVNKRYLELSNELTKRH